MSVAKNTDGTVENVKDAELTRTGNFILWVTAFMTIARIGLSVTPFVFILGAENWGVLYFVIFYTLFFGLNFIFYLAIFCTALVTKIDPNKIFGANFTTWNPLRRFYVICIFSFIDYAINISVWYSWLTKNNKYLNSPNNSNTPNTNSPGFFSFQILCGAFLFSSVVYAVLAYQLMRSLRNQRQQLLDDPVDKSGLTQAQLAAMKQIGTKKKIATFPNIELSADAAPGLVSTTQNANKRFVFTGVAVLWIVLLLVYLFIYYVHTFDGATKMQFVVVTVFFWASFAAWFVLVLLYYVPLMGPSLRTDITNQKTEAGFSTAETHAELNYEMGGVFVSSFLFYAINIIFMIYAYVLDGPNKIEWNTVPKFNSLALVQSSFFYVWVTNAALNTGSIVFFVYNFVTIGFVIGWGGPTSLDIENTVEAPLLPKEKKTAKEPEREIVDYQSGRAIGVTITLFAVWFTFFGFVIDAMIGGHFLAKHIFPITLSFALVFFFLILTIVWVSISNWNRLDANDQADKKLGIWPLNKNWYLSTFRTIISLPVAYALQVIIMSYLSWDYFGGNKITSDWTCILPIDSSTPPPYSSCNIYWAVGILSLYCINLVYLVIVCNMAATTSVKFQVIKQAGKALIGKN